MENISNVKNKDLKIEEVEVHQNYRLLIKTAIAILYNKSKYRNYECYYQKISICLPHF